MPLEACMIVIDNSEFMRNGDYAPTRMQAQNDAVSVLFNVKTGSNPENKVGLMSMAGQSPQVLATLTSDIGKILTAISHSTISGPTPDLLTSLNVAQLALKHRENKNQRQRIIVFLSSPLIAPAAEFSFAFGSGGKQKEDGQEKKMEETLVKLGKKLKKNNVAVDVVLFGDEGIKNEEILRKFIDAVNSSDNSNLVSLPPVPGMLLSELLKSSSVLAADVGGVPGGSNDDFGIPAGAEGGDGAAGGGGGGGANDEWGGVDPDMDPEMAMVIRMSIQEAEERERREAAAASGPSTAPSAPVPSTSLLDSETAPLLSAGGSGSEDVDMEDVPPIPGQEDVEMVAADGDEDDDEDDEAAMLRAIAMSMEGQEEEEEEKKGGGGK